MCHSKIDELQDPIDGVHRSAGKQLVVDTIQTVVIRILRRGRDKLELQLISQRRKTDQ